MIEGKCPKCGVLYYGWALIELTLPLKTVAP
jgi:hypothetical protein